MVFCSVVSAFLVQGGYVKSVDGMTAGPSACYITAALVLGNNAMEARFELHLPCIFIGQRQATLCNPAVKRHALLLSR